MNHVRLEMCAHGRESEIHPMYDVLANGSAVERATALQWNWTGDTLGFLHHIVGDIDAFESTISDIDEVIDYKLEPAGADTFYAYLFDETTPALEQLFEPVTYGGLIVVPPMEYHESGHVSMSAFGPAAVIQTAIENVPDPIDIEVRSVSGLTGLPQLTTSYLSERQQEALTVGLELGYYAVPREASQEDVADELGCAPSTAAEHLQKAETKVVRSVLTN